MERFTTDGFELAGWQHDAVASWVTGDGQPWHGTLEIFTGGGKTLIALACVAAAASTSEDLKFAVVVPTAALARQWIESILTHSNLERDDVGLMGAGGKDDLANVRAMVCVLNTASKQLPAMALDNQPVMLIVDECHRAGAPSFSRVLSTVAPFRLGLSATPGREELDDEGQPLSFDDQRVGRMLGNVVYRFNLKDARQIDWLPTFTINHHGLGLHADEKLEYDSISRSIDDLADRLRDVGVDTTRARDASRQDDQVGELARTYVNAVARRKDLLYRAMERSRVAVQLVVDAIDAGKQRILLFHERVEGANVIFEQLGQVLTPTVLALEHSELPESDRRGSLARFRSGEAKVLVSVRSLIEGIDVPDADVGISVAANSSVRQRIQAMGRVLRRKFDDGPAKVADMHLIYVADTVDELIYAKEDWSDLTGEANNVWLHWPLDADLPPEHLDGPPHTPKPTEDQEWERVGQVAPGEPVRWHGEIRGQEYSVDTHGTVHNSTGALISNPQDVGTLVAQARQKPGGRFWVTPTHQLVITFLESDKKPKAFLIGQLDEPFQALSSDGDSSVDADALSPGDPYHGPADADGGQYQIRSKRGGVIERRIGKRSQFAMTHDGGAPDQEDNARRVLEVWQAHIKRGIDFSVNHLGHAWYEAGNERRFLASVSEGFSWPDS